MATTKPEFLGTVLENNGNYCALFKRKQISIIEVETEQYYWLPTNQSGDIINERANKLNGYYESAEDAQENYPAGFGEYADNWRTTRYLSYENLYPFDDGTGASFIQGVREFIALGANNIVIPIFWSDVQQSFADTRSFAKTDSVIDFIKDEYPNVKISLHPRLYVDDDLLSGFWGESNSEQDEYGNPVKLGYGNGHPSLAYATGTDMMKAQFEAICEYYSAKLGSQLNWVMPLLTEQDEFGYNFQASFDAYKVVLYGYSPHTKAGFRVWLAEPDQYNGDINALNSAWGTDYEDFDEVEPPTTGKAQGTATVEDFNNVFASKRGVDFYLYREKLLYDFLHDCKEILTDVAPQAKFVTGFGGVSPNDALVPLRGSFDVIKWGEVSDGLKTAFAIDNRNNTAALTLDFVQNYPNKIMTELHHIDYGGNDNPPLPVSVVEENMKQAGLAAIQNGALDLLFIGMPKSGEWFAMLKRIFSYLKPFFQQNISGGRVTTGSVSINKRELIYSGGMAGLAKWQNEGGSNNKRLSISFDNNMSTGGGDEDYPVTLQLKDCSTLYLKQEDIKNSVYGFRDDSDPFTEFQLGYNSTRVPILMPIFGITYTSGAKTRCTIEITDNDGVQWLKMVQDFGVSPNDGGVGNYANNHPEWRYLHNVSEDCRFWLPITDYYDIKISVFDASCKFEVYHADTNAPDAVNFNTNVSAGGEYTYRLLNANMSQSIIQQRVIKLNCNRN